MKESLCKTSHCGLTYTFLAELEVKQLRLGYFLLGRGVRREELDRVVDAKLAETEHNCLPGGNSLPGPSNCVIAIVVPYYDWLNWHTRNESTQAKCYQSTPVCAGTLWEDKHLLPSLSLHTSLLHCVQ